MVKVFLHGELGRECFPEWNLNVSSAAEAFHAIEINTKKLRKFLAQKYRENVGYDVLINGNKYSPEDFIDIKNPETLYYSELCMKKDDLRTIDIIPILEGADPITLIIVGLVISVAVAVATYFLSRPPSFDDFRQIDQAGRTSYLFNGPENVIGEGGPVPVGYGRLIVGSQTISEAFVMRDFNTLNDTIIRDDYGNLINNPATNTPTQPFFPNFAWGRKIP